MGGKIRIHYVTDNLFLFPSFITILFSRFGAILKFSFVCSWGPIVSWKTVCWKLLYQTGQIFSRSEGCDIFFGGGSRVHKRADMLLSSLLLLLLLLLPFLHRTVCCSAHCTTTLSSPWHTTEKNRQCCIATFGGLVQCYKNAENWKEINALQWHLYIFTGTSWNWSLELCKTDCFWISNSCKCYYLFYASLPKKIIFIII